MYIKRLTVFASLILCFCVGVFASKTPQKFSFQGVVLNENGESIEFATISLNGRLLGTLSDLDGYFLFENLVQGYYEFEVSHLGYETNHGVIDLKKDVTNFKISLRSADLELDEVIVTAQSVGSGSNSKIGEDAIRHIQPKNLEDVLQLLPGGLTQNPSLNNLGQVSMREVGSDNNNAAGAAVVVDGVHLSNDANLQVTSFSKDNTSTGTEGWAAKQTTAGAGVDLRTVSVENIESIEVIRGIPSVEYGNLTSGIMIVNTKSGATPYEAKAKVDAFSKLVYVGKGFNVGNGAVNAGLDWSQSFADTRKPYMGYDRITANLGYSSTFNQKGYTPVTFNVRSSFYSNVNNLKNDDPQLQQLERTYRNSNMGGRMSISGRARFDKWITNLDYKVSGQMSKTIDETTEMVYSPDPIITNSMVEGMSEARFNERSYETYYSITGVPINIGAQVKLSKYIQISEKNFTNFKLGVDYKMDVNRGAGLEYDIMAPPHAMGAQTLRPRAFHNIPALHNLASFFDNDTKISIGSTYLKTNLGVRVNTLFLDIEKSGRSHITVAEPRANIIYSFIERHSGILREFNVFGGAGVSNKMPTLLNLYPDNTYFDYQNIGYRGNTESSSLAAMTTTIIRDTYNPDLKPMQNTKWEVGFNLKLWGIKAQVTYFNEHNKNEFGALSQLVCNTQKSYNVPAGADNLAIENGGISYTISGIKKWADFEEKIHFDSWYLPTNRYDSKKHGVEYTLDFGQLKALRTSLIVDGAWFYVKRQNKLDGISILPSTSYDFVPLRPAGSGTISQRVNSNFRFITHIPKVGLVFSTNFQVVWKETYRSIYEDSSGNPMYQLTDDGQFYAVEPLGFYDRQQNYHEWKSEYNTDPRYKNMLDRSQLYAYETDVVNPWLLINFRLTKEFAKIGEVSLIANNFMNSTHYHTNIHSTHRRQLLPSMYVGAELKLKL